MDLILNKSMKIPGYGTFGELYINGEKSGYIVGQEYNDNKPYQSCVPDGVYDLVPFLSPKYGKTFVMVNPSLNVVKEEKDKINDDSRFLCLAFHRGSYPKNFQGCWGYGEYLRVDGECRLFVGNTRESCKDLMEMLYSKDRTKHTLTIVSPAQDIYP